MTPTEALRQQIAMVTDPDAFKTVAEWAAYLRARMADKTFAKLQASATFERMEQRRKQALAKADAILALQAEAARPAAEPGSRFAHQAPPMTFQHGRHSWCQPRDEPRRHFFLRFADSDMGEQVFNGENAEAEAWAAWDKYAPAWNCYLIAVLAQHDRPAPTPGALADGGQG